jgi:hypothetical protein
MSVLASAPALPLHKAGPYVAAAYIVFVVLILLYVAILALRVTRVEKDVAALRREVESRHDEAARQAEHEEGVAV